MVTLYDVCRAKSSDGPGVEASCTLLQRWDSSRECAGWGGHAFCRDVERIWWWYRGSTTRLQEPVTLLRGSSRLVLFFRQPWLDEDDARQTVLRVSDSTTLAVKSHVPETTFRKK